MQELDKQVAALRQQGQARLAALQKAAAAKLGVVGK
jgi:hypothetical protein